ncbi:MAG: leucine-rich repeat domain-containing protein [Phycisphaerales bacterium]|nr:MAG: leucine-rich repeat domain-containing protein [Phycisphaerales bacterium]
MSKFRISLIELMKLMSIALCLFGTAAGQEPVSFADPRLKASVEENLGVVDPTPTDMLRLTQLYAAGKGIENLVGLEHALNLTHLNAGEFYDSSVWPPVQHKNRIADVSPLAGLTRLLWLNLGGNQVVDVASLSRLGGLQTVILYGNQIADISPLSVLHNLAFLDLDNNEIIDAGPLSGLSRLRWLSLSNNRITDTLPLSGMIVLETLQLERTAMAYLPELSALTNLKSLNLTGNQIADISGLSGLPSLETVALYGNRLTAITTLSDLPNLKSLGLGVNQITDVSGLSGLPSLEIVDLANNRIAAVPALTDVPSLKALDLRYNQITDISGASAIPSLRVLELGNNRISDIAGLSGLPNLETLALQSNQITTVPVLSDLPELKSLDLENNQITDVNALSSLPGLRMLNLQRNEIADMWPLTELGQLTHLDISRNPIDEHTYSNVLPVIEANNPGIELVYDPSPWAFIPRPYDGAADTTDDPTLTWTSGAYTAEHDVYFGTDQEAVINADPNDPNVYRGRCALDLTTYDPGVLEWNTTYYWRVDEINEPESWSPIVGSVWSFTTADFLVVDDFELYGDDVDANEAVFQTWLDGFGFGAPEMPPYFAGNGTGSVVGYSNPPYTEQSIVQGGRQSMPLHYDNLKEPWYSQTGRTWATPRDWTVNGMDTLQIFVRGESTNESDALFIKLADDGGRVATVVHPDPDAVLAATWLEWNIYLTDLIAAGVDVTRILKMDIGVGSAHNPKPGGVGILYVDDIRVIKLTP